MTLPFLIDNEQHRMADVLNVLLERLRGRAVGYCDGLLCRLRVSAREGCPARRGGLSAAAGLGGQPMGRSLHLKLKKAHESWADGRDDQALLTAVSLLAEQFGKDRSPRDAASPLRREDLQLICFELVTG